MSSLTRRISQEKFRPGRAKPKRFDNTLAPRRAVRSSAGSFVSVSRNTGEPHEHKREIARNLKRASI